MHFGTHEGRAPHFLRRFSEKQENFVRGNPKLQNPMFFVANTASFAVFAKGGFGAILNAEL
jgi:hypothetical protein